MKKIIINFVFLSAMFSNIFSATTFNSTSPSLNTPSKYFTTLYKGNYVSNIPLSHIVMLATSSQFVSDIELSELSENSLSFYSSLVKSYSSLDSNLKDQLNNLPAVQQQNELLKAIFDLNDTKVKFLLENGADPFLLTGSNCFFIQMEKFYEKYTVCPKSIKSYQSICRFLEAAERQQSAS